MPSGGALAKLLGHVHRQDLLFMRDLPHHTHTSNDPCWHFTGNSGNAHTNKSHCKLPIVERCVIAETDNSWNTTTTAL
jgi:hypothetical protein